MSAGTEDTPIVAAAPEPQTARTPNETVKRTFAEASSQGLSQISHDDENLDSDESDSHKLARLEPQRNTGNVVMAESMPHDSLESAGVVLPPDMADAESFEAMADDTNDPREMTLPAVEGATNEQSVAGHQSPSHNALSSSSHQLPPPMVGSALGIQTRRARRRESSSAASATSSSSSSDEVLKRQPPETDGAAVSRPSETAPKQASVSTTSKSDSPSIRLSLAYTLAFSVVYAVDVNQWAQISSRLNVTADTFRSKPVAEWASNMKVFLSRLSPRSKVLYIAYPSQQDNVMVSNSHQLYQVLAIEVLLSTPVSEDLTEASARALEAYGEFESYMKIALQDGTIELDLAQQLEFNSNKPTLWNVILALLAPDITTPEQRDQINQLVFAFLQNELTLAKLYSQLSQVVGYAVMRSVMRSIMITSDTHNNASTHLPPSSRSTNALSHIQYGDAAGGQECRIKTVHDPSQNLKIAPEGFLDAPSSAVTPGKGFPIPSYFFRTPIELEAFFSDCPRATPFLKEVSKRHRYPLWIDLPNEDTIPLRVGHHSIENSGVWLSIGGLFEERNVAGSIPTSALFENRVALSSNAYKNGWEYLTVVNQFDFNSHTQPLQGTVPAQYFGCSALLLGDCPAFGLQTDCIARFGGVNDLSILKLIQAYGLEKALSLLPDSARSSLKFSNEIHVLDLHNLKWLSSNLNTGEDTIMPPPRAFQVAQLVLNEVNGRKKEYEILGFFIMGGIGMNEDRDQLIVYDDAWFFNLNTGTWKPMNVDVQDKDSPSIRRFYGAAMCHAGLNSFFIQGGGWSPPLTPSDQAADSNAASANTLCSEKLLKTIRVLKVSVEKGGKICAKMHSVTFLNGSTDDPSSGTARETGLARAFHSAFLLRLEPRSIDVYDLGIALLPNEAGVKNVLVLAGGLTSESGPADSLTLLDINCPTTLSNVPADGSSIAAASFITAISPRIRPFSNLNTNPSPYLFSTVNFFQAFSPYPSIRPKPAVPSFFISGGMPTTATNSLEAEINNPSNRLKSWLISLPSADPFELNWYTADDVTDDDDLSKPTLRPQPSQAMTDEPEQGGCPQNLPFDDEAATRLLKRQRKEGSFRGSDSNNAAATELGRLFSEHIRHNAAWMTGLNFTPGVFHALGSLVPWPFTAIGNLMENSCHLGVRTANLSIEFGVSKADGSLFLAVTDDGRGMPFTTLNKALKRFGHCDGPMERCDSMRNRPTLLYGLGMKFAFARLSQSVLVISRTKGCIGVAMLSQALQFQADCQALSAPACFWRLPTKDTVFPEVEHWRNQQKIQQYSPFKSATALAEQINTLGHRTGTRIIFFDSHEAFPTSIAIDATDGLGRLSSTPNQELYANVPNGRIPAPDRYYDERIFSCSDRILLSQKVNNEDISENHRYTVKSKNDGFHKGQTTKDDKEYHHLSSITGGIRSESALEIDDEEGSFEFHPYNAQARSDGSNDRSYMLHKLDPRLENRTAANLDDDNEARNNEQDQMGDENDPPQPAKATSSAINGEGVGLFAILNNWKKHYGISNLQPSFPAWTSARDSIDYCLSTYAYWAILFNCATLWHSGVCIAPPKSQREGLIQTQTKNHDPFHNSLWRYLKSNLHGLVELDYLFRANDAQAESFGLLGFLNPLETLIDYGNDSGNTNPGHTVRKYETGILLYYKERLIRRLFVPFPAPAELLDRFGRGKYPKSHFQGKPIFMFPCTGVIQVPEWLLPNASRDDFVAARSPMFDTFTYNVKKLVAQYLSVCLDETARKNWIHARGEHFLREVGRNKPLTPLLHLTLFKSVSNKHFHTLKGHIDGAANIFSKPDNEMHVDTEGGAQTPDEIAS